MIRMQWLVGSLICLLAVSVLPGPVTAAPSHPINVAGVERHLGIQVTSADSASLASRLSGYTGSATPKAVAIAHNRDGRVVTGFSSAAGTRGTAAVQALAACENARQPLMSVLTSPCELILQGGEWVVTHRQLTQKLTPDSAASVWRVQGKAGVVYLAGSVHVLTPSFYPLAPAFEHAFSKADRLALELNPLLIVQPDRMAVMQAAMVATPDNVSHALGAALRERLTGYLARQGIALESVLHLKPAILSTQLSMQEMAAYGYAPQYGVDLHFAQAATRRGLPILELETVESQMQALTGMPLEVQAKLLDQTLDQLTNAQAAVSELVSSWLSGDADHLHQLMLNDFMGSPVMETLGKRLIDERNLKMAERIRIYLDEPSTTLVIVGAGHFGGEPGILQLLRSQGFSPQQLTQAGNLLQGVETPAVPASSFNQRAR